jgi:lipid-A-disaccharide synthase
VKIYIIAGEASGDLHASNLVRAVKKQVPDAVFRGLGGDLMHDAGVTIVKHYKQTAVMGVFNVLLKLRSIKQNLDDCKNDIERFAPDAVLLVDYPGFNLKIASFTKSKGLQTIFYIAPKVWASREHRVKQLQTNVDKIISILPFEKEYFLRHKIDVEYVGSPVVDAIDARICKSETREEFIQRMGFEKTPYVVLMCGSREHEVKHVLPYMVNVAGQFSQFRYYVAGVKEIDAALYESIIEGTNIKIVWNEAYALLQHAHAAMVTSGTATLETALLNIPQVVCYRLGGGHFLQWFINRIVKVPYISLVNLILNRASVVELLQVKLTNDSLREAFVNIALNNEFRDRVFGDYSELRQILGNAGASDRAATYLTGSILQKAEVMPK